MCTEYHGRALKVQELWHAKARKLNIPLSAKGHPVGQSGAFTGVAIDSFQGRFSMLPDKMASLVAARQELAASEVSTPRLIARVRGKALHYGCAIPFIAVAAPSLSQLMHGRETGAGPVEVPSLDTEKELEFDWDMKVRISERARTALEFMRIAMERYGDAGQPLWPVVPSSLYGAFLAGEAPDARILVITFDASVDGWGAVIRPMRGAQSLSADTAWPPRSSAGRSWTRQRSPLVRPRRCIGRRWRASSPRRPPASCTPWRTVPS